MTVEDPPVRLLYAVAGDPRSGTTQSGVAKHLLDALERRDDLDVRTTDTSLRAGVRLAAAMRALDRDRERWRWGLHTTRLATAARTRALMRALAAEPADVVLQLRSTYRPIPVSYAPYLDNTVHLLTEEWPAASPWNGRSLARVLRRERAHLRGARHVFATGSLVAESIVNVYGVPRERVSVIGGGAHFTPVRRPDDATRQPWILFVGRDWERKGGDVLVRAFRSVRERHANARLKLIGVDTRIDEPGVDVLGTLHDRARLADLYASSAVFALPSRYEPYGMALLEAMAHGLPCVAAGVGAMPEIVGATGVVVAPGDPVALSSALVELLNDPARARALGEAARSRVERELTWDHVAAKMAAVLRDC